VTDRAADPEQQAKEDYMRRLMCFRKDELILPEEPSDSDSDENEKDSNPRKKKEVAGIEAAYEFVEDVENKMSKIGDVIRGMDKRMSYNLRLVGSVIASDYKELDQMKKEDEK